MDEVIGIVCCLVFFVFVLFLGRVFLVDDVKNCEPTIYEITVDTDVCSLILVDDRVLVYVCTK